MLQSGSMRMLIGILLAAAAYAVPTSIPTKRQYTSMKLASTSDFADPSIYWEDPLWYSMATNWVGRNVQVAVSADFQQWMRLDGWDALPIVGKWVNPSNHMVWAPSIIKNDQGKYIMYYSADAAGRGRHCIGVAVADAPIGPYTPHDEPMFCDVAKGGAIDPDAFRDADGKLYVVYKVDGNSIGAGGMCGNTVAPVAPTPIMLQPLQGDGVTLAGAARQILDRSDWDGPLVEAPSLVRVNGKYVVFFSSWCYSSLQYDISYAMADSIWGPYHRYGPFAMTGTEGLTSPGGASIAADGKHLVFHANSADGQMRLMHTALIEIDTDAHLVNVVAQ